MERNDSAVAERPRGTVKHPAVAMALASGRILFFALRHGPKPLMVDYRTGDVWLYDESASE
ncbi:MAG: hypothetical protein J4G13_12870 [Dehalococcoidia bacterium]|nr:hypothetical protein [Dehalococcoidia bacterium]